MVLDNKDRALIAIYAEYQKEDTLNMDSIKAKDLGMTKDAFGSAILKLENEGYIIGSNVIKGGTDQSVHFVNMSNTMITANGIRYIENKLQINNDDTKIEKVKKVKSKTIEALWDKGSDLLAKVIAEVLTKGNNGQ